MLFEITSGKTDTIRVIFDPYNFEKLMAYIDQVDGECSGMGTVENDENGNLYIKDLFLMPCTSQPAFTEILEGALDRLLVEEHMKDPDNEEMPKFNLWWHSHVDMGVTFSSTDDKTIEILATDTYMLSIVANRKRQMTARLEVFKPFRMSFPSIAAYVETDDLVDIDEINAEIAGKVVYQKPEPNVKIPGLKKTEPTQFSNYGYYNNAFGFSPIHDPLPTPNSSTVVLPLDDDPPLFSSRFFDEEDLLVEQLRRGDTVVVNAQGNKCVVHGATAEGAYVWVNDKRKTQIFVDFKTLVTFNEVITDKKGNMLVRPRNQYVTQIKEKK
jgi:hypothetical protein